MKDTDKEFVVGRKTSTCIASTSSGAEKYKAAVQV